MFSKLCHFVDFVGIFFYRIKVKDDICMPLCYKNCHLNAKLDLLYTYIYFFCLCRWLVVHKEIKYDIQVTGLLSFVFTSFIHSDAHTEFSNEMFFLSINATPEHHRQPLKASSLFQWWQNINWLCIVYGTSERKSSICLYGLFKFSSKMKCSFLSHIDEKKKIQEEKTN